MDQNLSPSLYTDSDSFGEPIVAAYTGNQWKLGVAGRSELSSTTWLDTDYNLLPAKYTDADVLPTGPPRVWEFELQPTKHTNTNSFGAAVVANVGTLRVTQVYGEAGIALADDAPLRVTSVIGQVEILKPDSPMRITSVLGLADVVLPFDLRFTQIVAMGDVTTPYDLRFTQVVGMADVRILYEGEESVSAFVWMM